MKKTVMMAISALSLSLMGCSSNSGSSENLSGAGATFPAPFYKMAFKKYGQDNKTEVSYGAIGSGGGYRSLKDKTVDFGASDVFLTDDEMKALGAEVIHIPTVLGAVVLSYNLKDVPELKLDASTISDIFLGKITQWDDPKIKSLNAQANLPHKGITVVYRSDGSGSTAVFSEYMSKVNEAWKNTIGEGKSLNFPVGVSAKGNAGVSGLIAQTEGAIGYIGSEYSMALNLSSALIQNSSGNFVAPTLQSISAAANAEIPDDTRVVVTNSSNPSAYPISTFTWLIVYKEQNYGGRTLAQAQSLKHLLAYMISPEAQAMAKQTNYAPLPDSALEKTKKVLAGMTYGGKPVK